MKAPVILLRINMPGGSYYGYACADAIQIKRSVYQANGVQVVLLVAHGCNFVV